jgi:hypothetical protein
LTQLFADICVLISLQMFSLSGKGPLISCEVFPPLDVSIGEWEIGLVGLSTYNSIPNIEKGINDKFYFGDNGEITIPEGSYEIENLQTEIQKHVTHFRLTANNNTLKAEMKCAEDVHFEKPNSIASLLGFENKVYAKDQLHVSTNTINIIKVNSIRIECNIARGSFHNGEEGHTIHEFYPTVEPGYKILVIPNPIIYLPLNVQRVSNISVQLRDQNGDLVNFRDEIISLTLHVRKRQNGFGI